MFHALRSFMLARISATTSAFGFAPCGPPWWRRTLTVPASMSRPPMTSRTRRREEAGNIRSSSALEIFALNGVGPRKDAKVQSHVEHERMGQLRQLCLSAFIRMNRPLIWTAFHLRVSPAAAPRLRA